MEFSAIENISVRDVVRANSEVGRLTALESNILHALEMHDLSASEMFKAARMLRDLRRERRYFRHLQDLSNSVGAPSKMNLVDHVKQWSKAHVERQRKWTEEAKASLTMLRKANWSL